MANEKINWQDLNIDQDVASNQGTIALYFLAKQVRLAQGNSMLQPMLQSLF